MAVGTQDLVEKFEVHVEDALWVAKMDAELAKLTTTANIPGFRPGKAPRALLERRYGEALRDRVQQELISESLQGELKRRELKPMRAPRVEEVAYTAGTGLSYKVVCEKTPEVPSIDLATLSYETLELEEVPTEIIDRELAALAERHRDISRIEDGRAAADGDFLLLKADGFLADTGEAIAALSGPMEVVLGAGRVNQAFEEGLLGLKKGESRSVPLAIPEDSPDAALAGKTARMEVVLQEHFHLGAVPEGQALAEAVGLPDEQGLRGRLRAQVVDYAERASSDILRRTILDDFARRFPLDLPPSAVEDEYNSLWHQYLHERAREEASAGGGAEGAAEGGDATHIHAERPGDEAAKKVYRALAARRLRLGVILTEIARRNGLSVSPDEVRAAMEQEAARHKGQEKETLEMFKRDPSVEAQVKSMIIEGKTLRYIEKSAKVKRRPATMEEIQAAMEALENDPEGEEDASAPESVAGDSAAPAAPAAPAVAEKGKGTSAPAKKSTPKKKGAKKTS